MNKRILYHGSSLIVKEPNLFAGRPRHDFGRAFYLTSDQKQAEKWSRYKIKRRENSNFKYDVVVTKYELDCEYFKRLKIKIFSEPSEEWLQYIVQNRTSTEYALSSDYDLIKGPVVDGNTSWLALRDYTRHKISFEETLKAIKPDNLVDQWAFKTENAIKCLEFGGAILNEKSRFVSQEFIDAITEETGKLIAASDHISVEQAINSFKNSKVYEYLYTSPEPFYEEDPQYFYELFENYRKGKGLLDNTELYLKKHPELYSMP